MLILGAVLAGSAVMSRWRRSAAVRWEGLAPACNAQSIPAPSSLTSWVTPDHVGTSHFFVSKTQMITTVPPS